MQIKVNSREIDSYAIKNLKTTLADHVGDEYALLLGRRLQEGMAKISLFNKETESISKYNENLFHNRILPYFLSVVFMCLSAQVLLVMYFMANNIGFGLRTLFYELLFTGVCVIVLFIAFHWLANSKAIRDYPKCKKDCYNQNDIAFINAILADQPLECTIVKAYQRNESYFIYTENEAFDVTKFITDRSQYSTELEIVQLEYIRHTAISEDGDPDSICMENYICLRQKGSAFTPDEPISETEKEEIMTIYNNRFSFIEVYP